MTEGAQPADTSEVAPSRAPRWLAILLVAIAVGGLAFAIGRFSTFASSAVAHPTSDSADAGFARDMQVHHDQAVTMALEIYRKTDDDQLRSLSYDIATTQSAQRGEMYGWLVQWGLPQAGGPLMSWMSAPGSGHDHGDTAAAPKTDAELRAEMGMASPDEMKELDAATGRQADCLFLTLMIRHHQGAIPMAEAVIDLGSDARVRAVAQSMVQTQSAEIDAMESMQSRLTCAG